jgi:hypothetical protein
MIKLMKKVDEYAKEQGIDRTKIAKHIGANSSSVTYYFDGTNHMSFIKFIKMIQFVYRKDYDDLIIEYCEYCRLFPKKKPQAVREALDWSLGRWNSNLTKYLLGLEKKYCKKTYEIYNLLFLSRERKISPDEFFKKVHYLPYDLKGIKKKDLPHVQVMIDLCTMYDNYYNKEYGTIDKLAKLTFEKIEQIPSEFLRYSLTICVKEMLAGYSLKYNKVDMCNKILDELTQEEIKNLFPLTYFSALSLKAEINVFTDYSTSLYYIEKAISEMERLQFHHYARIYEGFKALRDLIKIVNNDFKGLYLNDEDQRLHYLAMLGDEKSKDEAVEIIQNILNSGKELDEFQTYFQAILNKDLRLMIRAEEMFMEARDFHYVKLARKYIKKWGGIHESKEINQGLLQT